MHFACLPTRLATSELILTAGDGISTSDLQGLQQQAPHLPVVVEDPDADEREEVILEERNVAREAVDPQGLLPDIGWWEARPWIPDDLPPQSTAVQIPRRLQAAWCEVKNHSMEAILTKEGLPGAAALPEWKALLRIDQLMLQAPSD